MTDPNALRSPADLWTPGTVVEVSRDTNSQRDVVKVTKAHPSPLAQAIADRLMDSPHLLTDPLLAACVGRLRACENPNDVLASTILAYAEAAAEPHE